MVGFVKDGPTYDPIDFFLPAKHCNQIPEIVVQFIANHQLALLTYAVLTNSSLFAHLHESYKEEDKKYEKVMELVILIHVLMLLATK